MIRAVMWKEFREQWLIGATLVVLGGGLLAAAAVLGDPPKASAGPMDVVGMLGLGRVATLMLVVTAGMVCGGALFAAEREAGTITFLEVLPGSRGRLWRAKVIAGVVIALVQTVLLLGIAAALGLAPPAFAARLVVYGLLAFVWGTFGSTLARTTLGSVGFAVPSAVLATFVYLLPISLAFAPPGGGVPRPAGWLVFEALMIATPLALSARWFTAPDRARRADSARPAPGFRALLWLGWRQMRLLAAVLSAFALAFGCVLLVPEAQPLFVWPGLALAAGALAGVTAFGDEQVHRTGGFWAEGRLPIGRAWAVKVGLHLALVAWLLALLLAPSVVRAVSEGQMRFGYGRGLVAVALRDRLFDELGPQSWKYLAVPAVYGFAAGHVCGLVFRKLVVACGVAMVVGGCLAALWGPSLLAGGVRHWQVWLPALALIVTGRLVVRPWTTDRLLGRGPLARLGAGTGAALAALTVGIGARVLEVPDSPDSDDDLAYVAALPTYDENVAGREFRSAVERYSRAVQYADTGPDGQALARLRPRPAERLETAVRSGWVGGDPEFAAWLDRVFAEPNLPADERTWHAIAEEAATKPVGQFESPRLVSTTATTAGMLDGARRMAVALLAWGLQEQAGGTPEAFWKRFATVVALARNMQNGGGVLPLAAGQDIERIALTAAERWLERHPGRSARPGAANGARGPAPALRSAIQTVASGDTSPPLDMRPHLLADRFVLREQMRAPGQWLIPGLTPPGGNPDLVSAEADLVGFAWAVPWERERTRRLLSLGFEPQPNGLFGASPALLIGRPGAQLLLVRNRSGGDQTETDQVLRTTRRAMILKLAIRAHMDEKGGAPATLADLTTGPTPFLPSLPEDPYADGRPFGYRISAGETLRGPPRSPGPGSGPGPGRGSGDPPLEIRSGQVLLWSVGADGTDQGGTVIPGGPRSEDMVFLVPMFTLDPR
ncbi:ABC transporter permease [Gemmata sp. JC673]|uniref:ABC transporter permease n=1 Tax=Gemmata algarum TaxID=2975278 RepID=A0ABU5F2I1_9BACT|nr:hypothetical protein [Gemmata algarum]MDY3561714.1 ABC transporter permease [Gemmata algarum]